MADYISTDPNFGLEEKKQYLSTDPGFGLDQAPSVGEIAQHAGQAAVETAKEFIPKSLGEVLGFVTPIVGATEDIGRGYGMLKDVLFGKPINQATAEAFPETQILPEAEKTAPYSKERFKAGFGTLAQMGMAALGIRALTPKSVGLTEPLASKENLPLIESVNKSLEGGEINAIEKGIIEKSSIAEHPGDGEGGSPSEAGGGGGVEPVSEIQGTQEIATVPPEQPTGARPVAPVPEPTETTTAQPLAPVPSAMINAVRTPSGKIVGHGIEHGDVISGLSEKYDPSELNSGWVIPKSTKAETDATFIGTDDVQKTNGDFEAAFKSKGVDTTPVSETTPKGQAEPIRPPEVQSLSPDTKPLEVGPNVKGFETVYGPGEIKPGESISPEDIFRRGQSDLASGKDPYAITDRARTGDVSPKEIGLLAAEHDRLLHEAAAAEGTPEYEAKYLVAKDFAQNMLKPAGTKWHQTGMGLQVKAPVDLSNLTGFRSAFEERFNKEMTPTQAQSFSKIAGDVARAKAEDLAQLGRTSERVQQRFKGIKDISFEDAVSDMHNEIKTQLKDCIL